MLKRNLIYLTAFILFTVLAVLLISTIGNHPSKQYKLQQKPKPTTTALSFPGEFEKQQAIWLMWPSDVYNTGSLPVYPVTIKIIKVLSPYIPVNLMVQNQDQINHIQTLLKTSGYTGKNLKYYVVPHYSIWTRDVGPIFVKTKQNQLKVVNFGFNNYSRDGNPLYIDTENQVDKITADKLNLSTVKSALISEGGAIESNGKGTMMTTESVVLKRNPDLTKDQIEQEYKRVLGIKKIIWLKRGLAEDDQITSGHINEFARFASPNTILLAQILPEDRYATADSAASYLRLEENFKILRNSTDQAGKPFRIIRIPMPPTLYSEAMDNGKVPLRSYLNYAVTNGAVIMQTYWKPGRSKQLKDTEAEVKKMFQQVFPGRDIIGIDAENVNLWGGGLHCITQHMPAN